MSAHPSSGLTVAIENDAIVIRLPLDSLGDAVEGAWVASAMDVRLKVTDSALFAPEVVRALDDEAEDGTTAVHRMFDLAFLAAFEQGAEGVEEVADEDGDA